MKRINCVPPFADDWVFIDLGPHADGKGRIEMQANVRGEEPGTMNLIAKLRRAHREGDLGEKAAFSILHWTSQLLTQSYRLRSRQIQSQSLRISEKLFPTKEAARSRLLAVCGDVSRLGDFVSAKEKDSIVVLASSYLKHKFTLLGAVDVQLDPIDWHSDFKSGFRWGPGRFYKDYVQVDVTNSADVKIPRELSRSHHLLTLGEAYLLSKDDRFAEEYVSEIEDWIEKNPLMYSINWGCTMDVAIRAVNWIWAAAFFVNSPRVTDGFLTKLLGSLYQHGWFVYRNAEKQLSNNSNHYFADLVGQIYLGLLFLDTDECRPWLLKGTRELFRETRLQVLPSGADYERSINYHRLVLEMLMSAVTLLRRNHLEVPSDILRRLESMVEFTMHYTKPDGTAPVIGDQDDGRLHPFSLRANVDHRYLLSLGSVLFNRPDFKRYSDGFNPDCFFLLGPESKSAFSELEERAWERGSKAFPDAGFFVLRNEPDHYMFVNLSGKGCYAELGAGTHTHSDLLSFELYIGDKAFLVDPGSFVYSADPAERKLFRSTQMHNTVVVDDQDQNVLREEELWDFERNAIPKLNSWVTKKECDLFDAEHSGYMRLEDPVIHRRVIQLDKMSSTWKITDFLNGHGRHKAEWFFHFDTGITLGIFDSCVVTSCSNGANICLSFEAKMPFAVSIMPAWVSRAYGVKAKSVVAKVTVEAKFPVILETSIRKIP